MLLQTQRSVFTTGVSETAASSATAKMTLSSAGALTIGTAGGAWGGAANGRDLTVHGGSETTTGVGQISVVATDAFGANLGGGISFGGEYSAAANIDWATLWGRKENATDDNTAGYMQFNTRPNGGNMAEAMRIDSAGNVGIGTTAPTALVTAIGTLGTHFIASQTQANDTAKYGAYAIPHYHNAEQNLALVVGLSNGTDNTVYMGGGVGELNAATILSFNTAANDATTGGSERMRITSAGNVGIGTASPTALLHVSGEVVGTGFTGTLDGILGSGTAAAATTTTLASTTITASGIIKTDDYYCSNFYNRWFIYKLMAVYQ